MRAESRPRAEDARQVDEFPAAVPAPPLRPYIARYQGYRQRGVAPGRHRGLPSPFLTLIFTLDEPLTVAAHPDPGQPPGRYHDLLGGLHARPALITHDGAQSGVQVALRPPGARALFGLPPGELAHLDVPAGEVLGRLADEVRERMAEASGWPERFAVLDALLGRALRRTADRVGPAAGAAPEVLRAWELLLTSGGAVPVGELAAETGWSPRHLGGRFRTELGLGPKQAARVIRFHRARRLLPGAVAGGESLAAVAAACGYYDQAHLAREFRALAGCPPSRWLAEEHPTALRPGDGAA